MTLQDLIIARKDWPYNQKLLIKPLDSDNKQTLNGVETDYSILISSEDAWRIFGERSVYWIDGVTVAVVQLIGGESI